MNFFEYAKIGCDILLESGLAMILIVMMISMRDYIKIKREQLEDVRRFNEIHIRTSNHLQDKIESFENYLKTYDGFSDEKLENIEEAVRVEAADSRAEIVRFRNEIHADIYARCLEIHDEVNILRDTIEHFLYKETTKMDREEREDSQPPKRRGRPPKRIENQSY